MGTLPCRDKSSQNEIQELLPENIKIENLEEDFMQVDIKIENFEEPQIDETFLNYNNPWAVTSFKEFLCYNCPECEFKDPDENTFYYHAIKNHPKARQFYNIKNEEILKNYEDPLLITTADKNSKKLQENQTDSESRQNSVVCETQCDICFNVYKNKSTLTSHKNRDHQVYKNKSTRDDRTDSESRQNSVTCDICFKVYKNKSTLNSHKTRDHRSWKTKSEINLTENKKFNFKFKIKNIILKDISDEIGALWHNPRESSVEPLECCNIGFEFPSARAVHFIQNHMYDPDDKILSQKFDKSKIQDKPCPICGFISRNPKTNYNHKRKCIRKHEHTCHECDLYFRGVY